MALKRIAPGFEENLSFFILLCVIFAPSRLCVNIFSFWDFNFHFLPKSLCSNAFIEYGRKLLVSY